MAARQLKSAIERPVPAPRTKIRPTVAPRVPSKPLIYRDPRTGRYSIPADFFRETDRKKTGTQARQTERIGRRFIEWRLHQNPFENKTQMFMNKIGEKADTSFYIRYAYSLWLRNIHDDSLLLLHHNRREDSQWVNDRAQARAFLEEREAQRLAQTGGNLAPATNWVFDSFEDILVKIIFTRPPLIGTGPPPDWLRVLSQGRHGIVCLDTYQDNLCLWRCLAVFQGARIDRGTQKARELAQSFYQLQTAPRDCPKTSLDVLEAVERHLNHDKPVSEWLGFRVFEPERQGGEIVWRLMKTPNLKTNKIITIGVYEGHAFLTKRNIEGLGGTYICPRCQLRLTQVDNLQRHIATCSK